MSKVKGSRRIMFELYEDYLLKHGTGTGFRYKDGNRSYYACEELGEGWIRQVVFRLSGKLKGNCDVEYYSPHRTQLRSRKALIEYTKGELDLTDFNFREGAFASKAEEEYDASIKNTGDDKTPLKRAHGDGQTIPVQASKKKRIEQVSPAEFIIIDDNSTDKTPLKLAHPPVKEEVIDGKKSGRKAVSFAGGESSSFLEAASGSKENGEKDAPGVEEEEEPSEKSFTITALCDFVDEKIIELSDKSVSTSDKSVDNQPAAAETSSEDGEKMEESNGDEEDDETAPPDTPIKVVTTSKKYDKTRIATKILTRIVDITNVFFELVDEIPRTFKEIQSEILSTSRLDIDHMLHNPGQRFLGKIFKLLAHLFNHHQFLPALESTSEMFHLTTYLKQNLDQCFTDAGKKTVIRKNLNKAIGLIMKLEN